MTAEAVAIMISAGTLAVSLAAAWANLRAHVMRLETLLTVREAAEHELRRVADSHGGRLREIEIACAARHSECSHRGSDGA